MNSGWSFEHQLAGRLVPQALAQVQGGLEPLLRSLRVVPGSSLFGVRSLGRGVGADSGVLLRGGDILQVFHRGLLVAHFAARPGTPAARLGGGSLLRLRFGTTG